MRLAVALASLLAGCTLVRAPIVYDRPVDAGPGLDAPLPDVPGLDAPLFDAPLPDVPGLDAPMPDAPMLDAPELPDTPPSCVPSPEACNGLDDDCNGAIDDAVVCQACTAPGSCGACIRFVAAGRVYQSCPSMTGLQYWRRVCWSLGRGYDLAVPETAAESDAIATALRSDTTLDANHWIGANDFETNGTYVGLDATPLGWAPTIDDLFAPQDDEGALVIQPDGDWDDYPIDWTNRALCESDDTRRRCVAAGATDSTCDGVDDDCDGFVDEDCVGPRTCDARVFWSSVYYVCTDDMNTDAAKEACTTMSGSDMASLDHRFELAFADDFANADCWVGLSQSDLVAEPDGWSWADGIAWTSADADWDAMWDFGQPTTAATEDCAFIKNSSNTLQDQDCASNRTATLCELPLP